MAMGHRTIFGMRRSYDLAALRSRPNPYADSPTTTVTLRLGTDLVQAYERFAEETGVSMEVLIDRCLRQAGVPLDGSSTQ